jgi:uncharacterized membrane protein HdeD (DUF308 family)
MQFAIKPSRNSLLLRSVLNIIFGILILVFPGISLLILALAFSINLLITGLFMIFEPAFDESNKHAFLTVLLGLFSVGAGIYLLSRPLTSVVVLSVLIGAWSVFFGILDLFIGFKLTESKNKMSWTFLVIGLLSLLFGIYIAFNPLEGSLALVWVIGVYSLINGLLLGFHVLKDKPASPSQKAVQPKKSVKAKKVKKGKK